MKAVDEIVDGFLSFLSSNGQLKLLSEIVKVLSLRLKEESARAEVTSAVALTEEEKSKIAKFLKKKFGQDFEIKVQIDEKIIGGLIIKVGDQVIDQSLVGRLNSLTEKL